MKLLLENRIFLLVFAALLILLSLSVYSYISLQRIIQTASLLSNRTLVISQAEQIVKTSLDIETGQRGYVITGDPIYLEPFTESSAKIESRLRALDSLMANKAHQQKRIDSLRLLIKNQIAWSEKIILARKESFDTARVMVITGTGKNLTDKIRALVNEIQYEERKEFSQKNTITSSTLRQFQFSFLGLNFSIIIVIVYLTYTINRTLKQRNKIEDRLKNSIVEVQNLYDHAPCGYLSVNHKIQLTNINQTLLNWLGYAHHEVVGIMKYEDLLSMQSREKFLNSFNEDFKSYTDKGSVSGLEFEFMRKDGSTFPAIVNSSAVYNDKGEFVSSRTTVFDDTERQKTEQKFSVILESSPDGLIIVDKNGIIKIVNRQTEIQFGYNRDVLINQPIELLIPMRNRSRHHSHLSGYFSDPHPRPMGSGLELFGLKNDGTEFPIEISLSPIDYLGDKLVAAAIRDITERKQTDKLLREREERFRLVVNSAYDAIIILDENGRVLNWNCGAEVIFGWKGEEIIGKSMSLVIPEKYRDKHAQGMERYKKTRQPHIIGKIVEMEGLRKDNTIFPLELSITTWQQDEQIFYCGIIRDISERKNSEKLVSEMAAIVESSEDAIISLTNEGNIFSWNKGAENLYGYKFKEVKGTPVFILVPDELQEEENQVLNKVKLGEYVKPFETTRIKKDDTQITVSLTVSPIKDALGNIIGISKIARDITEQKRNKDELHELNKELDAFTYSVSHDLRAPLRSIAGYAKILLEDYSDKITAEGVRVTNVIVNNAHRMGMLIDDLLNFSRLGRKALNLSRVNMHEIVEQLVNEYKENNPELALKINQLPAVTADNSMITQVWINLISNAIKYSGKNPEPKIEIGSFIENDETCFYVRDNGVGFDMKYYDKLFGVFQRLHKMNEFEGTGVGLALIKKIIEKHNGRVWAEGKLNAGAVFYFSLPNHININDVV
jgi:PAS domain S-box-containing protein